MSVALLEQGGIWEGFSYAFLPSWHQLACGVQFPDLDWADGFTDLVQQSY